MATYTSYLNLAKPGVDDPEDYGQWGGMLNGNADAIDGEFNILSASGIARECPVISGQDLNSLTTNVTGFFQGSGMVNAPEGLSAWLYVINVVSDATKSTQRAITRDATTPRMWVRNKYGGVWGSWVELFNTANFTPADYAKLDSTNNFSVVPNVGGDPIVESGVNSDGTWLRTYSGIQWIAKGQSMSVSPAVDGEVNTPAAALPVPFIDGASYVPAVSVIGDYAEHYGTGRVMGLSAGNINSIKFRWCSNAASASGTFTWTILYTAMGRWK